MAAKLIILLYMSFVRNLIISQFHLKHGLLLWTPKTELHYDIDLYSPYIFC